MFSEDKFSEHEVYRTIDECIQKFKDVEGDENLEFFNRIVHLCQIIKGRIEAIDFYTSPSYLVDSIQNNLKKASTECSNYLSNKNAKHLSNVERNVEGALLNSKHLFVGTEDIEKDYAETLSNFRKSASQHLRYFEKEVESLTKTFNSTNQSIQQGLKSIQDQLADQKKRIDSVVSDFQKQVSELQQQQLKNFQENENTRQNEFQEKITTLTTSFNEKFSALIEKSENELQSISNKTTDIVQNLKEKQDEALTLVGVIANTGMAGGYQKVANQAMWTKRIWQGVTVISLAVLVWFSIYMYGTTIENASELSLGAAGIRAFVTIAIALFAGYAAKQADNNSKTERRSRQMELELSSIDMYLAKFDEAEQLKIKMKLSDKWFGNLPIEKIQKESPSQTTLLGQLGETVRNLSEKIGK